MTSTDAQRIVLRPLLRALAENWWLLLLRGIAAIAFGALALAWPRETILTLTLLWGIYALFDGVLALWEAVSGGISEIAPRWWLALVGIAGIGAAIAAFAWPGMTALILLWFIAGWAIFIGVLHIWGAFRLRIEAEGEWLLGLSGVLLVAFGVIAFARPGAGALALIWLIAWFAIAIGAIYIWAAFRLRKFKEPA
ncbi:MAG: DUF308 domain-containing protein [Methylovirgula sp.]|nr:DUF308 domain-containing protein [Methylovirgula sp.]